MDASSFCCVETPNSLVVEEVEMLLAATIIMALPFLLPSLLLLPLRTVPWMKDEVVGREERVRSRIAADRVVLLDAVANIVDE